MFPAEPTPDTIGAYKVVRRLPGAGRAEVYLARSQGPMGFARECDLKLLPDTSEGSAAFAEELAREAAICAKLNHPAVVRVFDFFEHDGKLVLALEHVEGTTLEQLLSFMAEQHKRLGDAAAFYIGQRIAGALADAHAATDADGKATPIVHRNLTPENVLVSLDGEVRLTGFGVGKILGRTPDSAVGTVKGTPGFMAPEQARGEPVTTKADVYGIGLLLWSLLSGRRPPADGTWPRRISGLRPDLSREVAALVEAALDHFPGTRKITAREMEQWLAKSAPAGRGKAELKERVALVRAEPELVEAEEAPISRPPLPVAANPFQGVRFGPPPPSREPPAEAKKPAEAKGAAEAKKPGEPARTTSSTALSKVLLNLPPPAPLPPMSTAQATPSASAPQAPVAAVPRPTPAAPPVQPAAASPPAQPAATPPPVQPVSPAPQPVQPVSPAPSFARADAPPPSSQAAPPSNNWSGRGDTVRMRAGALATATSPTAPGVAYNGGAGPASVRMPAANGAALVEAAVTPPLPPVAAVPAGVPPPPPPRAPQPSLLGWKGRRPLSPIGTIVVSAITATVVVIVAFYVFLHRQPAVDPAAASSAPPPPAPPAATPAPVPSAAPSASAAAPPSAADLPYGFGYLTVVSPAVATVYVSGKLAGPVNEPLKVRCGRWFVRLATPRSTRYPEWVSAGETVVVACQGSTRIEMGPAAP